MDLAKKVRQFLSQPRIGHQVFRVPGVGQGFNNVQQRPSPLSQAYRPQNTQLKSFVSQIPQQTTKIVANNFQPFKAAQQVTQKFTPNAPWTPLLQGNIPGAVQGVKKSFGNFGNTQLDYSRAMQETKGLPFKQQLAIRNADPRIKASNEQMLWSATNMLGAPMKNLSSKQIQLVKNGFNSKVREKIGQWAVQVETGRLNKADPLNDYVYSLGETVFGKQAAFLSPKQLLNALDVAQQEALKLKGYRSLNIGLSTGNVREGRKGAEAGLYDTGKLDNLYRKMLDPKTTEKEASLIEKQIKQIEASQKATTPNTYFHGTSQEIAPYVDKRNLTEAQLKKLSPEYQWKGDRSGKGLYITPNEDVAFKYASNNYSNPEVVKFTGDKAKILKVSDNYADAGWKSFEAKAKKAFPNLPSEDAITAYGKKLGFDGLDFGKDEGILVLNQKAFSRVAQPMSQAQDSLRSQPSAGLYDVAIAKRQGFNSVEEYKNWFLQNKDAFPESMVDNRIQSINSDIAKIKNQISDLKANTGKETGQVNLISGKKQIIDNSRIVKQLEAKLPQYEQDLQEALLNKKFYEQSRVAQPLQGKQTAGLYDTDIKESIMQLRPSDKRWYKTTTSKNGLNVIENIQASSKEEAIKKATSKFNERAGNKGLSYRANNSDITAEPMLTRDELNKLQSRVAQQPIDDMAKTAEGYRIKRPDLKGKLSAEDALHQAGLDSGWGGLTKGSEKLEELTASQKKYLGDSARSYFLAGDPVVKSRAEFYVKKAQQPLVDMKPPINRPPEAESARIAMNKAFDEVNQQAQKGTVNAAKWKEANKLADEYWKIRDSLQQPLSDAKPLNMKGNVAKQIDEEINGGVKKARLSQKAIAEGITEPRKGSDIAVPTQAGIKARVKARSMPQESLQSQIKQPQSPLVSETYRANSYKQPVESLGLGKVRQAQGQQVPNQSNQAQVVSSLDDIVRSSDISVKSKVNFLDYLRTPDRVLQKMGLGKEAALVRQKYNDYLDQLPVEIGKITEWSKQVSPQSNQRIFKYLDGQPVQLDQNELRVANEIKGYLAEWADKLKLPQDKRITNYITHIFDKDFIQKEFDPEIAAMIRDKVPGSVYDPFVQQRLGKAGYVEDTWRALDAYVKRATRKYNMDEALEQISSRADGLEDSQFNYVKRYVDKINMRPGQVDNLIDNFIKSTPIGYKLGQRPLANVSRQLRQWVYRGTLGLNVGSALRNLTQGANTYAQLGEKYTAAGYYKLVKSVMAGDDELKRVGVLRDDFIQDRTLNATHKAWEKLDKGLWVFFNAAEKINRGAAYYGAKSRALAKGASEEDAIKAGIEMVRKTQFTFGSVDTPQALQSDLAKSLLQFQSYNLKQAEFLIEMVKNKEFAGLARYSVASAAMLVTIGELLGMKPTDFIPFYGTLTGTSKIGNTPPVQLVKDVAETAVGAKDEYGNQPDAKDRLDTFANDMIPFIPGGVQIKKTVDFLQDNQKGYDASRTGRVKYPIQQTPDRFVRGVLFGSNNLPEGQEYYKDKRSVLSENQTEQFKQAADPGAFYNQVMQARRQNKAEDELKAQVEKQGGSSTQNDKIYYNDNGSVKSIDLTHPTTGQGIDAFTNENWNYTKAREIWKAKTSGLIDESTASQAYSTLGVDEGDVRYDYIATKSNDIKTQYIMSKNLNHDELINRLVTGRVVSATGRQFASDGVINNLRDEGLITDYEAKALKKLKVDKTGKPVAGAGRKSGRIRTAKRPKFGKAPTVKIKLGKANKKRLGSVRLGKAKTSKTRVKGFDSYESDLKKIARSTGAKV